MLKIIYLLTNLILIIAIIYFFIQKIFLLKFINEIISGNILKTCNLKFGPLNKISKKINILIYTLLKEKETMETILQENKITTYHFNDFFLNLHSTYSKEKAINITLNSLYKIFRAELIMISSIKNNNIKNFYISPHHKGNPILTKELNNHFFLDLIKEMSEKNIESFESVNTNIIEEYLKQMELPNELNNLFISPLNTNKKQLLGSIIIANTPNTITEADKQVVQSLTQGLINQLKIIEVINEEYSMVEKLGNIINMISEGIIIFDYNKNIVMENPIARDYFSLNKNKKKFILESILNDNHSNYITLVLFKNERVVLDCRVNEFVQAHTKNKMYIMTLRNITENQRKDREKSEIFFLTTAKMQPQITHLVKTLDSSKSKIKNSLKNYYDSSYELLNKLIYYTEIENGPLRLAKKPTKINHFINNEIANSLKESFKTLKIEQKINCNDNIELMIDCKRILLAINIIVNFNLTKRKKENIIFIYTSDTNLFNIEISVNNDQINDIELYELNKKQLQIEKFMQSEEDISFLNIELPYASHILDSHGGSLKIKNIDKGISYILSLRI